MMTDDAPLQVYGGVDTHADVHVAAAADQAGRVLGTASFPATADGYAGLLGWLRGHGVLARAGVEGTGSYGAGLARYLAGQGVPVLEVTRPDRQRRRRHGKSDPVDAVAAAMTALRNDGDGCAVPKTQDGPAEDLRALRVARRGALKARTQAGNQLRDLVLTAPAVLRDQLAGLSGTALAAAAAALPAPAPGAGAGIVLALASLAARWLNTDAEAARLDAVMDQLTAGAAPALRERRGAGPQSAAALVITIGDNPARITSEAGFAALCGAAPVDACSGKQQRHRLSRGGDRQANSALWRIVTTRIRTDPRTQAYVDKRTAEGKTRKEIIRCLKRYVAREIWKAHIRPATG
jgi:transposase